MNFEICLCGNTTAQTPRNMTAKTLNQPVGSLPSVSAWFCRSTTSGSSDYAGKAGKKATAEHQDAIQGALMHWEPAPVKTMTYV